MCMALGMNDEARCNWMHIGTFLRLLFGSQLDLTMLHKAVEWSRNDPHMLSVVEQPLFGSQPDLNARRQQQQQQQRLLWPPPVPPAPMCMAPG